MGWRVEFRDRRPVWATEQDINKNVGKEGKGEEGREREEGRVKEGRVREGKEKKCVLSLHPWSLSDPRGSLVSCKFNDFKICVPARMPSAH